MASTLQIRTSKLCGKLLDYVSIHRYACAVAQNCTPPRNTSAFGRVPLLGYLIREADFLDQLLVHLRSEIDSALPLEDLRELSDSALNKIYNHLDSLDRLTPLFDLDLLNAILPKLYFIRELAIDLKVHCAVLDDELCHDSNRWTDTSDDEEDSPKDSDPSEDTSEDTSDDEDTPENNDLSEDEESPKNVYLAVHEAHSFWLGANWTTRDALMKIVDVVR